MANYWAIEVGIHQYRFLPPLSYAQRDAELMHEFLIQAGGFAAHRCSLLTDAITITPSDTGFPTAENIQAQIAQRCQQIKSDDVLLCFFSGYGLTFQGQDYLLPIEADPRLIATTAISIESLLQTLQTATTKNIVLILDANRSQLGWEYGGFGEQTAQLAKTCGIAVLLSCRPQQFSHEPLTLRQGIFTTALIAAMQEGVTLEQVVAALSDRLPKLSEECWRPRQDLVAIVPPHLRYQILLPEPTQLQSRNPASAEPVAQRGAASNYSADSITLLARSVAFLSRTGAHLKTMAGQINYPFYQRGHQRQSRKPDRANPSTLLMATDGAGVPLTMHAALEADTLALSDQFFWRRLLVQSGLIGGILLFGVILRNSGALINTTNASLNQPSTGIKQAPSLSQPAASSPSDASAVTTVPTAESIVAVDPALLMQSAQTAFESQQYEEANRQLAQIPATQRTPEHNQLLEQTNRELMNKAKTMLIRPRQMMPENQVSDLAEAIKVVRLIEPDQLLYQEAQQGIERWSRLIMDMAQGRQNVQIAPQL